MYRIRQRLCLYRAMLSAPGLFEVYYDFYSENRTRALARGIKRGLRS